VNGWSDYSPIGYLLAASKPEAPGQPEFVSASATEITVKLSRSIDNGGSPVLEYSLWIDDGNLGQYSEIESYSQEETFVIDNTVETSL